VLRTVLVQLGVCMSWANCRMPLFFVWHVPVYYILFGWYTGIALEKLK